jgi:alpha-beta hydrolase superfamily lysophospholipase
VIADLRSGGSVRCELVRTTDDVDLVARCWPAAGTSRGAVVIAHGFGAHANDPTVVATAHALCARGYDVVAHDARGHGGSAGSCTLGDLERLDVAASIRLAAERADRVVLVGASMGAIAVLRCAAEHDGVAGVVALSCPARWTLPRTPKALAAALVTRTAPGRSLAARALRVRVARSWTNPVPPVELVTRIDVPVALLHGTADSFIPVSAAHDLYAHTRDPRRLDILVDAGHAFSDRTSVPVADAVDWTLARASY